MVGEGDLRVVDAHGGSWPWHCSEHEFKGSEIGMRAQLLLSPGSAT